MSFDIQPGSQRAQRSVAGHEGAGVLLRVGQGDTIIEAEPRGVAAEMPLPCYTGTLRSWTQNFDIARRRLG
jgi:hypothetical protein